MNKILPGVVSLILFVIAGLAVPVKAVFAAPSLQFDKSAVTVKQNETFSIKVQINVDSNPALGSDAIINYAGADLEVLSITNGGFFPEFGSANNASGRLELHGYTSSSNDSRSGNGTLATVVFKGKKSSGSSTISFACQGNGSESNILTTTGTNILTCANTNTSAITYSGTTATVTPTASATPTPTQPGTTGSGNTAPTCSNLYSDISSATGTPVTVTLTCSGTDPGGYLNAAEFTFGDGAKQIVEKNAGSPGSIAISHTYTTIGTFGMNCRVRDNDNVWSNIPASCTKTLTIRPGSTVTPTPTRRPSYGGTATPIPATPTPTTVVVDIISETPEPIETLDITPTPIEGLPEEPVGEGGGLFSGDKTPWIVGGIIALIMSFLLLRRKKKFDRNGAIPLSDQPYTPPSEPPSQPPPPPPSSNV